MTWRRRTGPALALLASLAACGSNPALPASDLAALKEPTAPAPSAAGLFALPVVVKTPGKVYELAAARLNGDRRDDLVVSGSLGRPAFVLIGTAEGGFALSPLPTRAKHPVVADLDGDGAMDVVGVDGDALISLHRGQGDGTVAPPSRHVTRGDAEQAWSADMDGDGDLDLVALNGSDITMLRGDGAGGFDYPVRIGNPGYALAMQTLDLRGDGSADVVVATDETTLSLMRNDGRGGLAAPEVIAEGVRGERVAVADLNGDGRDDLLHASATGLAVRLADGRGGLGEPIAAALPKDGYLAGSDAVGDLNGDSFPDIVLGGENRIRVALGDGAGRFGTPSTFRTDDNGLSDLAIADVDGDCAPDVVAGVDNREHLLVLRNTSKTTCPPDAPPTAVRPSVPRSPHRAATGAPGRPHLRRPDRGQP